MAMAAVVMVAVRVPAVALVADRTVTDRVAMARLVMDSRVAATQLVAVSVPTSRAQVAAQSLLVPVLANSVHLTSHVSSSPMPPRVRVAATAVRKQAAAPFAS